MSDVPHWEAITIRKLERQNTSLKLKLDECLEFMADKVRVMIYHNPGYMHDMFHFIKSINERR